MQCCVSVHDSPQRAGKLNAFFWELKLANTILLWAVVGGGGGGGGGGIEELEGGTGTENNQILGAYRSIAS